MHYIGVTVDAGHTALLEHRMRAFSTCTGGTDRVRIMTAAAGDTVLPAQFGLNLRRELRPVRFPVFRILEIVRHLHEDVTHTGTDMGIRLDEPVGRGDVAVGTSGDDSLAVVAVL